MLTVDASQTVSINGAINGSGGLTKNGGHILELNGTNTYTGDTTIHEGILAVGSDTALGATGVGGATLKFTGGTLKTTAAITSDRPVMVDTGGGTINPQGFDLTLRGTLSGIGSLHKDGEGTLTLSGASTNPAAIHVTGGALIGNTGSLK